MKMLAVLAAALFLAAPVAKAEHCNPRVVDNAAYQLQQVSSQFASFVRALVGDTHTVRTATELAEAAEALHEAAHHGQSCQQLNQAFVEVKETFEHLAEDVQEDHALHHNPQVNIRFAQLRAAYLAVQASLSAPPPLLPITTQVGLGSSNYRYNATVLPGQITAASVAAQQSRRACILNSTFGFNGTNLWVNHGCRAIFSVTYLGR